jgi:hypothetical protein
MAHTITAPQTAAQFTPAKAPAVNPNTVLDAALEHARRLTAMYGTDNIEVALAWETVEELQVAARKRQKPVVSSLIRYCQENPDAPECRIYED